MTTVLVADDQEWNRDLIARYLVDWGYEVVVASNGIEALEAAKRSRPQLILMDLRMPGMDGWQARAELSKDAETSGIPIVALTAETMHGDCERILAAGFQAYQEKPIQVGRLRATLKMFLEE